MTMPVNAKPEHDIQSYSAHFGVHGFFSDNFAIGRRSGDVTIVRPVQTGSYNLEVMCRFDITLTNGTQFQNTSRAEVRVTFNGENVAYYIRTGAMMCILYV